MGATQSTAQEHTLETKRGNVKGIQQSDLSGKPILQRYTGIPYAQPPTGQLRWRRPQPLSSEWSFNGNYTKFGAKCPQPEYGHRAARLDNPDAAPEIDHKQSEDCLYLNIWVPAGQAPASGWPVQFHIHGGWLQVGDACQTNDHDPYDLLAHSTKRIIVAPTYRLNLFGFLAGEALTKAESKEPVSGNYGLWDQRAALEWTYENISLFGGDPKLISVGGLSAGAHSALMQLYYDTNLPKDKQIIKQAYFWSNSMAIQPNSVSSDPINSQWNELCQVTGITTDSKSPSEILAALRDVPIEKLVSAIHELKLHTFRTCTDNDFVSTNFLQDLHNGNFTAKVAEGGVRIIVGEVADEALLYKLVNPPTDRDGLKLQLRNYYPNHVVDKLLTLNHVYDIPQEDLSSSEETKEAYRDVFARMVADLQVHASIRGLARILLSPADEGKKTPELLRYRVAWRAKGLDGYLAPAVGVCHAADTPIWWASGYRAGYSGEDKQLSEQFLKPFGQFLEGKSWSTGDEKGIDAARKIGRYIDQQGQTHENIDDEHWERCTQVWDAVAKAQNV